ncbi:MAG: phosphatase PAP2 family protein [Adlercreutzia equolifaciens]
MRREPARAHDRRSAPRLVVPRARHRRLRRVRGAAVLEGAQAPRHRRRHRRGALALTRLYCYVHYPTDVLAGTIVGLLAGFAAAKSSKRQAANFRNGDRNRTPSADARSGRTKHCLEAEGLSFAHFPSPDR